MLAWDRQLASLEVLIAVRFRGAVARGLVRVRACGCAVGKGWLTCSFGRYVQVGLHVLRNWSSFMCKALSGYLAGHEGCCGGVMLGGFLGCHWMFWAEWLDLDDKLGAGKASLTFTVLNICSLVPCFTESLKVPPEFRIETLERFLCSDLRGIY